MSLKSLSTALDLVKLIELTTGRPAVTFPITTQDITDDDNGVYHSNSIMQPHVAAVVPVVDLAITAASVVPGRKLPPALTQFALGVERVEDKQQQRCPDKAEGDQLVLANGFTVEGDRQQEH